MKLSERFKKAIDEERIIIQDGPMELKKKFIEAIQQLEQNQIVWHKWPDEKPKESKSYLVWHKGKFVVKSIFDDIDDEWDDEFDDNVVAWAELPKYEVKG